MGIRTIPDNQEKWGGGAAPGMERIDVGGDSWDDNGPMPEAERPRFERPMEKVIPIRVTAEQWQALREGAERLGIGPTTLVRMWALEQLRAVRSARQSA
jgi:hypothetical protein